MTTQNSVFETTRPRTQAVDSCVMVIFGATGDLTKRKLIPALCNLARAKLLPDTFAVIGVAFDDLSTETFREHLKDGVEKIAGAPLDAAIWAWLSQRLYYARGEFQDPKVYAQLKVAIARAGKEHGIGGNCFFYLAVAPQFISEIVKHLGAVGLAREQDGQWRRVIIEKPFGHDLDSARALNTEIRQVLEERQIYRIDHYLGKETVQNLMVFRFGNGIFEPIWNRRYIDHVAITAAETVGVEHRGGYYDSTGALRDMVPSHLLQLVTLTAMEPPVSFNADAVRDEQTTILHAIQPFTSEDVLGNTVRSQYGEGKVGDQQVPAYCAEPDVAPASNTETFVALKLLIDNWRWADVPFYLRTGKRLNRHLTEIAIQFRRVPFVLFRDTPVERLATNRLVIRIQPDEGISLHFGAKVPGPVMQVGPVNMDFKYADYFGCTPSTGYERLIHDCIIGDPTLFRRADMVEAGWNVVMPVLDAWKTLPPRSCPNYAAGTWGPKESDELLARDGRAWRQIK